jgi:hypothetical protein
MRILQRRLYQPELKKKKLTNLRVQGKDKGASS